MSEPSQHTNLELTRMSVEQEKYNLERNIEISIRSSESNVRFPALIPRMPRSMSSCLMAKRCDMELKGSLNPGHRFRFHRHPNRYSIL